jgi:glyoxylate/hydroxypyruvate reductase A
MTRDKNARPTVLFMWDGGNAPEWRAALEAVLGPIDFRRYPETGEVSEIDYVMTWMPPVGVIGTLPNLKAIFSIGAGVSHILRDPAVGKDIPIVRLTDEALSLDMALHAAHWVLHFHRGYHRYRDQEREGNWSRHAFPANEDRAVGVLGLGAIGQVTAATLQGMHFKVAGWSKSRKDLPGIQSFTADELESFLERTEILVSVLPPTAQTENILNAQTLAMLPKGAFLINMGRGDAIVDEDLLSLLDSGHIAAAALDVFRQEPLPPSSPYWSHPQVYVTPHAAGPTSVKYGAKRIAENIQAIEAGRTPHPVYDWAKGY